MADYYSPTVVQQTIPNIDITPLERLVLTHMFESEPDGDGLYFFASESTSDVIWVDRAELEAALAASEAFESGANAFVTTRLAQVSPCESEIELDYSVISWEPIFQDVVRRSATLEYVSVIMSFTCTKMRPEGFGGMAILITADTIAGKSTEDILCELMDQAENGSLLAAPGHGVHNLLTLDERDVRAEIDHVIENHPAVERVQIKAEDVTGEDIRAACFSVVAHADFAEEKGAAVFKAALAAVKQAEQRQAAQVSQPQSELPAG